MFNNQYVSRSEIERELREKPHICEFMKEMLTASKEERFEAVRILNNLKQADREGKWLGVCPDALSERCRSIGTCTAGKWNKVHDVPCLGI